MKYRSIKSLLTGDESLIPTTFIDKLEDLLHGFLGIVLFVISILAAGYTLQRLIETRPFFPAGMIQGINDILFVVIILEIMRTVIVDHRRHRSRSSHSYRWCFTYDGEGKDN
jgi:uncharacterized membrane protein (DUF373 family)